MPSYEKGDRVIFEWQGEKTRGKITKVEPWRCRVVTDSGHRLIVPTRRLKPSPDRVLILETRLDRNLRSARAYGRMMQQWLSAYSTHGNRAEALYERVHTVDGLRRFLQREGKNAATRFVHIMAHGSRDRRALIHLTFDKLDLVEQADVFKGLHGKVLIFSCCDVGADPQAMRAVKTASGAAAVIGYRLSVYDSYTNMAEVMLYDRLLETRVSPQRAVSEVAHLLRELGIRATDHAVRKPVLVCY